MESPRKAKEAKRFFFEKKKQKTFPGAARLGAWSTAVAQAPRRAALLKVFWFFFSKKNRFLLL
jgi:hypothetical protein